MLKLAGSFHNGWWDQRNAPFQQSVYSKLGHESGAHRVTNSCQGPWLSIAEVLVSFRTAESSAGWSQSTKRLIDILPRILRGGQNAGHSRKYVRIVHCQPIPRRDAGRRTDATKESAKSWRSTVRVWLTTLPRLPRRARCWAEFTIGTADRLWASELIILKTVTDHRICHLRDKNWILSYLGKPEWFWPDA